MRCDRCDKRAHVAEAGPHRALFLLSYSWAALHDGLREEEVGEE